MIFSKRWMLLAILNALAVFIMWDFWSVMLVSNRIPHLLVSAAFVYGLRRLGSTLNFAIASVFLIGLGKEMLDPQFDFADMCANIAGIVLGIFL